MLASQAELARRIGKVLRPTGKPDRPSPFFFEAGSRRGAFGATGGHRHGPKPSDGVAASEEI